MPWPKGLPNQNGRKTRLRLTPKERRERKLCARCDEYSGNRFHCEAHRRERNEKERADRAKAKHCTCVHVR